MLMLVGTGILKLYVEFSIGVFLAKLQHYFLFRPGHELLFIEPGVDRFGVQVVHHSSRFFEY